MLEESRPASVTSFRKASNNMEGFVPWPEDYVTLYKEKGYWKDLTLGEHLALWVSRYGNRPALAYRGKEITYNQMDSFATKLAYQMIRLGMKSYDRVILQLLNVPELVYVFYACMKFGAIPICTLPTHRWSEIAFLAKESEAKAHALPAGKLKDFDYEEFAEKVQEATPSLKHILTLGKPGRPHMISLRDLIESDTDLKVAEAELLKHRPDPMEPALFQLSGGTTGVPKIIPRTHNDYAYNTLCSADALEYDQGARLLLPLPVTHNLSLVNGLLPVHSRGGTVVLSDSSAPLSILQAVQQNRAESGLLVNTVMHRLLEVAPEQRRQFDVSSLKRIIGGWSSDDPEIPRFMDQFHCDGVKTYGMTEGLVCWTRWSDPPNIRLHTDGRPVSEGDELKIVDPETGTEVPVGQVGEMLCRGPYTIRGYYKAPERNVEAFTSDGYYRTGDLVRVDTQRNVIWTGRIKDCIDRGGEKINAEEVEAHILSFPKVKKVAVVGMPDKAMGERICAFIVPKSWEVFTIDELCDFLMNKQRIAKFKLPERIEFVSDLPVTKVGKYEKKSLREKIIEKLKAEAKV
jgi:2,3-dihydroxybenzoate-AMP ligase